MAERQDLLAAAILEVLPGTGGDGGAGFGGVGRAVVAFSR